MLSFQFRIEVRTAGGNVAPEHVLVVRIGPRLLALDRSCGILTLDLPSDVVRRNAAAASRTGEPHYYAQGSRDFPIRLTRTLDHARGSEPRGERGVRGRAILPSASRRLRQPFAGDPVVVRI
jgi:hypothetical protein